MSDIFFELNKEQKEAVMTINGPVLIIAGDLYRSKVSGLRKQCTIVKFEKIFEFDSRLHISSCMRLRVFRSRPEAQ